MWTRIYLAYTLLIFITVLISHSFALGEITQSDVTQSDVTHQGPGAASPIQQNYFFKSCNNNKAPTAINQTQIKSGNDKHRMVEFIKKLAQEIEENLAENHTSINNMYSCLQPSTKENCPENLKKWISKDIPQAVTNARFHLKMAESGRQIFQPLTTQIPLSGTYKIVPWSPMNSVELNRVRGARENYRKQFIQQYFVKGKGMEEEVSSELLDVSIKNGFNWHRQAFSKGEKSLRPEQRQQLKIIKNYYASLQLSQIKHRDRYLEIMSDIPMLTYIKSDHPTPADILQALEKMRPNSLIELTRIKKVLSDLNAVHPSFISSLYLVQYKTITDAFLLKNPQYCDLADAAVSTKANRDFVIDLSTQLPMLVASFFLPPLRAAGLVLASSSFESLQSYKELLEKREGAFSRPIDIQKNSRENTLSLENAQRENETALIMIGLNSSLALSTSLSGQAFRKFRAP